METEINRYNWNIQPADGAQGTQVNPKIYYSIYIIILLCCDNIQNSEFRIQNSKSKIQNTRVRPYEAVTLWQPEKDGKMVVVMDVGTHRMH